MGRCLDTGWITIANPIFNTGKKQPTAATLSTRMTLHLYRETQVEVNTSKYSYLT